MTRHDQHPACLPAMHALGTNGPRPPSIQPPRGALIPKKYQSHPYGITAAVGQRLSQGVRRDRRLTKITDGTGNTEFKYDIQGRLIQKKQTTGTVIKTVSYSYDTLGRMSGITYPSGKVLTLPIRFVANEVIRC